MIDNRTCQRNIPGVDIAKGIGILFVVAGHFTPHQIEPSYWVCLRSALYTFHMPLFMFLSGFLHASSEKQLASINDYQKFVGKKFKRLMIPYFCVTFLLFAMKWSAAKFFQLDNPISGNIWELILLNPSGGFSASLWFLYTLFIILLLFPIIKNLVKNSYAILLLVSCLSLFEWTAAFCLNFVFDYIIFFVTGYIFFDLFIKNKFANQFENYFLLFLITFSIVFFITKKFGIETSIHQSNGIAKIISILLAVCGTLACFFAGSLLTVQDDSWLKSIFLKLGGSSASIYLLHNFGMGPVKIILTNLIIIADRQYFFPLMAVIVIAAGLIAPIFFEKYLVDRSIFLSWAILGKRPSGFNYKME